MKILDKYIPKGEQAIDKRFSYMKSLWGCGSVLRYIEVPEGFDFRGHLLSLGDTVVVSTQSGTLHEGTLWRIIKFEGKFEFFLNYVIWLHDTHRFTVKTKYNVFRVP